MFMLRTALVAFALAASTVAEAGTQVLGFEIGVTTIEQLKQGLSKKTGLEQKGANKYSGGEMFETKGGAYDIQGLTRVLYIFDEQKKLAGVVMDMSKERFDAIHKMLNGKYKVTSQKLPFVGDKFAQFRPSDAFVELDAPHMSFTMEVRYIRNDLMKKFKDQSSAEATDKRNAEAAKF